MSVICNHVPYSAASVHRISCENVCNWCLLKKKLKNFQIKKNSELRSSFSHLATTRFYKEISSSKLFLRVIKKTLLYIYLSIGSNIRRRRPAIIDYPHKFFYHHMYHSNLWARNRTLILSHSRQGICPLYHIGRVELRKLILTMIGYPSLSDWVESKHNSHSLCLSLQ